MQQGGGGQLVERRAGHRVEHRQSLLALALGFQQAPDHQGGGQLVLRSLRLVQRQGQFSRGGGEVVQAQGGLAVGASEAGPPHRRDHVQGLEAFLEFLARLGPLAQPGVGVAAP